jgi:hypothetical protein
MLPCRLVRSKWNYETLLWFRCGDVIMECTNIINTSRSCDSMMYGDALG